MKNDLLINFLTSPATLEYFGTAFTFKVNVLEALLNKSSLADVAKQYGHSPEAARKHARKARRLLPQLLVDSPAGES